MKKLSSILLCFLVLFSTAVVFTGCGASNKYDDLINTLIELQEKSENLYNDKIIINGNRYYAGTGTSNHFERYEVRLQDMIITHNAIIERYNGLSYYYLFVEINTIKDKNDNIIWSQSLN